MLDLNTGELSSNDFKSVLKMRDSSYFSVEADELGAADSNDAAAVEADDADTGERIEVELDMLDDVPRARWGGRTIPLFAPAGTATWSLLNLVIMSVGVLILAATLTHVLRRKRKENKNAEALLEKGLLSGSIELIKRTVAAEKQGNRIRIVCIEISFVLAFAGCLLFVITNNFNGMTVIMTRYTIPQAIILCAIIASSLLTIAGKEEAAEIKSI